MGKGGLVNIQTSYSGIKKFLTCPKQFHEVKILKRYEEPEGPEAAYGKLVHTALENYAKGIPLPENYRIYQKAVDAVLAIPGARMTELKMAIDKDKVPCDFEHGDYWLRGIADLVIIDGDIGYVVDYKTGSDKYADLKQLRLMGLFLFIHFPALRRIKTGLLFLKNERFIADQDYLREDVDKMWEEFHKSLFRMAEAGASGNWYANPSGLCKRHCVVVECSHNGNYMPF